MQNKFSATTLVAVTAMGLGLSLITSAIGQQPAAGAEAIIYRDQNFQGPAMNASAAQPDLRLAWQVRSITVVRGQWEICTRPNYVGDCARVSANMSNIAPLGIGNAIQSMRPVTTAPLPVGGFGPSLRGMNAEFFSQPSQGGQRILACQTGSATANCARATAEQFCRARGYNFVGNVSLETAGRRVVLADVLCKRTNA